MYRSTSESVHGLDFFSRSNGHSASKRERHHSS
jgi:hypothetical protein